MIFKDYHECDKDIEQNGKKTDIIKLNKKIDNIISFIHDEKFINLYKNGILQDVNSLFNLENVNEYKQNTYDLIIDDAKKMVKIEIETEYKPGKKSNKTLKAASVNNTAGWYGGRRTKKRRRIRR